MIRTSTAACFIVVRIVRPVIDTVVNCILCAVRCFLGRQSVSFRVSQCHCDFEGIRIIDFLSGLVHDLLGDIDTTFQRIGRRKIVSQFRYRLNTCNRIAVFYENHVDNMQCTITVLAHDHRMVRICRQLKVIIDIALFKDIIMSILNNRISRSIPCDMCRIRIISRTILCNHQARSNADIVRLLPFAFLCQRHTHRCTV